MHTHTVGLVVMGSDYRRSTSKESTSTTDELEVIVSTENVERPVAESFDSARKAFEDDGQQFVYKMLCSSS